MPGLPFLVPVPFYSCSSLMESSSLDSGEVHSAAITGDQLE